MKHFYPGSERLLTKVSSIGLPFLGLMLSIVMTRAPVKISDTKQFVIIILVISLAVTATIVTHKIFDMEQKAKIDDKFLPKDWEKNYFLLDESVLK